MKAPVIRFGTDGWRAVIAGRFTFANLERVARATAHYWLEEHASAGAPVAVVGYDRRFLSDAFARTTAAILAAHDIKVLLAPAPVPTPSVSFAVQHEDAVGGVMITASHNPPEFNGFKLKGDFGGPADPAMCRRVEALIDRGPNREFDFERAWSRGLIRRHDPRPAHFKAIRDYVDFKAIRRSGLRFAHDALFGVGAGCFEPLLAGTNCAVTTLNGRHDPNFGGICPEPVEKNYGASRAYLRRHPHDVCLVTDGDADRIGGMDGRGNALSTHQLICLLLEHFVRHRDGAGRVVKALTTTSMVDRMCEEFGLPLTETGVGFKHIGAEMRKGGVLLGCEESGGLGFPGHIPERDGLLAGMLLLEMLAVSGRSIRRLLAGLERRYGRYCYLRKDLRFPVERREELMEFAKSNPPARLDRSTVCDVKTFDGVKYVATDGSWLMLRGSGTEPVLRVYAETKSPERAARLIRLGERLVRSV